MNNSSRNDLGTSNKSVGEFRATELVRKGERLLEEGKHVLALENLRAAANLAPMQNLDSLVAQALFPGPSYKEHLSWLHSSLRPKVYLEIGVAKGATMKLAGPDTRVIGVDPAPRWSSISEANVELYSVTSNLFFLEVVPKIELGPESVDFCFIDGLHLFEQALKDFVHVEQLCHRESMVVIHDTLPVSEIMTSRTQFVDAWCGDVWKLLPCLQHYRPDLKMRTIPCFPSGLTLISNLDPSNRRIQREFDSIVSEYMSTPFSLCEEILETILTSTRNELV